MRGRQRAARATRRIGRQLDRALQESGCRGQASASLRSVGGALELSGDVLVGARHRLRAVPGAAIRIELGIRHLPASPRTTSAPLRPARTASSSRSKTSHSLWRPRNIEAGCRLAMSVVQS